LKLCAAALVCKDMAISRHKHQFPKHQHLLGKLLRINAACDPSLARLTNKLSETMFSIEEALRKQSCRST
jgi:hypothetical protein